MSTATSLNELYSSWVDTYLTHLPITIEKDFDSFLIALQAIIDGSSSYSVIPSLKNRITKIEKVIDLPIEGNQELKKLIFERVAKKIEELKNFTEDEKIKFFNENKKIEEQFNEDHLTEIKFPVLTFDELVSHLGGFGSRNQSIEIPPAKHFVVMGVPRDLKYI